MQRERVSFRQHAITKNKKNAIIIEKQNDIFFFVNFQYLISNKK